MYISEAQFTVQGRVFQINEIVPNNIVQENKEILQHVKMIGDESVELLTDSPSVVDVEIIKD